VGVVAFPPKFKGRFSANWSRANFTAGATVNYIGGVKNTGIIPPARGASPSSWIAASTCSSPIPSWSRRDWICWSSRRSSSCSRATTSTRSSRRRAVRGASARGCR